jgi:uncharacterized membrane protein
VKLSTRWSWLLDSVVSQLWFRASLFSVLAVLTALAAMFVEPMIPEHWPAVVGADAVDGILSILAASMLTVTVFSLTTMVSAYSAATANVTPRATRLLIEDSTSQNALSTFLGAFLFSLVGIIALSTGVYGRNGRLVLFGATLLVILLIVVTLLRWISHLSTLGQVGDTIRRVELATTSALDERLEHPYLGGAPIGDTLVSDPRFGLVVLSEIASRALSPGINDPGTAIAVIGAAVRILERWREPDAGEPDGGFSFPHVQVPGLSTDDLLADFFGPIARDGASVIEVGVRLQKALATLSAVGDEMMRQASQRHSAFALEHAAGSLALESDRRRLAELAAAQRRPSTPRRPGARAG